MSNVETARFGAEGNVPGITVLGAGVMGVGITALAAGHGCAVTLVDMDQRKLDGAEERIAHEVRMAQMLGAFPDSVHVAKVVMSRSVSDAAGSFAVIEAITENAERKAKVIAEVSAVVSPGTLLVSNTSSIPIDELAAVGGTTGRPDRQHFMNPPYLIRTVEVIRGARTGERTLDAVRGPAHHPAPPDPSWCGTPRASSPAGVLHPMINDAARVVQEGTATVEYVDALCRAAWGTPTGPLRTADLIGLDNLVDSLNVLYERTGDERLPSLRAAAGRRCGRASSVVSADAASTNTKGETCMTMPSDRRGRHGDRSTSVRRSAPDDRTGRTWPPDTDLFATGGLSSLFAMELVVHLEKTYGISDPRRRPAAGQLPHRRRTWWPWSTGSARPPGTTVRDRRCRHAHAKPAGRPLVTGLVGDRAGDWDRTGRLPVDWCENSAPPALLAPECPPTTAARAGTAAPAASSPPTSAACAVRCAAS